MVGTLALCGIQPLYKSARSPHHGYQWDSYSCITESKKLCISWEERNAIMLYATYNMCNRIMLTYNNVGSLHHKWKAIQNNHNMQGLHVIFFVETWLSPQQNQDTTILNDFCQYWLDSTHVSSHRGMLMYIKQNMNQTLTHMWDTKFLEFCWCDIPFQNTKLQRMDLYKPPATSLKRLKHELDTVLCSINVDIYLPLILLGDCHIDILGDNNQAFLTYMHNKYKLQQHISTSTTLAGICIDLVFSNLPDINAYALVNTWSTHHTLVVSVPTWLLLICEHIWQMVH